MSDDPELDQILRDWLSKGATAAPAEVAARAIDETGSYTQSELGYLAPARRSRARRWTPTALAPLLAGLAVVLAVVIVAVWIGPSLVNTGPVAGVSQGPSALGTPSTDAASSQDPGASVVAIAMPQPIVQANESHYTTLRGQPAIEFAFAVVNWRDYDARLFDRARGLPGCAGVANPSRTWVSVRDSSTNVELESFCALRDPSRLSERTVDVLIDELPVAFYLEISDRLENVTVQSTSVQVTPPAGTPPPEATPLATQFPSARPSPTPVPSVPSPAGWSGPTFISPYAYSEPSLVLDAQGNAHAAIRLTDGIWYVTNMSGRWTRVRLSTDLPGGQDHQPDIAIDGDGTLWVAFARFRAMECQADCFPTHSDGVYVVNNSGGAWSTPIRAGSAGDEGPSIAVRGGVVQLAVTRSIEGVGLVPVYLTNAAGSWSEQPIAERGGGVSLRIGSDGRARVTFTNGASLYYAVAGTLNGDFSVSQAPDGGYAALALDAHDVPSIVSHVGSQPQYTTLKDGSWSAQAPIPLRGYASGIETTVNGSVDVLSAFYPGGVGLWYATNQSESFVATQVYGSADAPGNPPFGGTALAVDSGGRPHVLFVVFSDAGAGLWYAVGPTG